MSTSSDLVRSYNLSYVNFRRHVPHGTPDEFDKIEYLGKASDTGELIFKGFISFMIGETSRVTHRFEIGLIVDYLSNVQTLSVIDGVINDFYKAGNLHKALQEIGKNMFINSTITVEVENDEDTTEDS